MFRSLYFAARYFTSRFFGGAGGDDHGLLAYPGSRARMSGIASSAPRLGSFLIIQPRLTGIAE